MSLLLARPNDSVASDFEMAQAMRLREIALPPDMRMTGPKRELRDAILARKLMSEGDPVYPDDPLRTIREMCERNDARIVLKNRIEDLSEWMAEEDVARCEEVARTIYSWTATARRVGR
jgi:hypothetical protein